MIPAISGAFLVVHRHYAKVAAALALRPSDTREVVRHTVIVLVSRPTRAAAHAVRYATAMRPDHLFALTIVHEPDERAPLEEAWAAGNLGIPLEIVEDPYRDLTDAVMAYLDEADAAVGRRHDHGGDPRVRGEPLVGARPAQPERAGAQGAPALPAQHRRHVSALAPRLSSRSEVVEGEVELEHVHARLAEEPEVAAVGVVVDEREHLVELEAPLVGHASGLEAGVGDGDVRVEARPRRR